HYSTALHSFFMDEAFSSFASTSVSKETVGGPLEEAIWHSTRQLAKELNEKIDFSKQKKLSTFLVEVPWIRTLKITNISNRRPQMMPTVSAKWMLHDELGGNCKGEEEANTNGEKIPSSYPEKYKDDGTSCAVQAFGTRGR
ncbi:hypothetical protein STEG23_003750, partial [Scotinomys teguina]